MKLSILESKIKQIQEDQEFYNHIEQLYLKAYNYEEHSLDPLNVKLEQRGPIGINTDIRRKFLFENIAKA